MSLRMLTARVVVATWFVSVAGCGANGHGNVVPSAKTSSASKTATLTFTIVIPQKPVTSKRRTPAFISASTKSATITLTPAGSAAQTQTVNCTSTCQATFVAIVGNANVSATLFDALNGTGTTLATGSLATTIVAAQANAVTVTFNPVLAQARATIAALTTGTPGASTIVITAKDPDGNIIIGPGAFTDPSGNPDPIALSNSDASGHTTLSVSTYATASAPLPKLNYDGTPLRGIYPTITLSHTTEAALAVPVQVTPAVAWTRSTVYAARSFTLGLGGTIWFSEDGIDLSNNVQGEVGSVTPGGLVTEYPVGGHYFRSVALGSDGNIWGTLETNLSGTNPAPGLLLRVTPSGAMTTFAVPFPNNGVQQDYSQFRVVEGADNNLWWFTFVRSGPSGVGFFSTDTNGNLLKSGYFPNEPGGTDLEFMGAAATSTGFWATFGPQLFLAYHIRVNLDGSLSSAIPFPSVNGTAIGMVGGLEDIITSADDSVWEAGVLYSCSNGGCSDNGSYMTNTTQAGTSVAFPISPNMYTSGLAEGVDHRLWFVESAGYAGELEAMSKSGVITDTGLAMPTGAERMLATSDGALYISVFCPDSVCPGTSSTAIEKVIY